MPLGRRSKGSSDVHSSSISKLLGFSGMRRSLPLDGSAECSDPPNGPLATSGSGGRLCGACSPRSGGTRRAQDRAAARLLDAHADVGSGSAEPDVDARPAGEPVLGRASGQGVRPALATKPVVPRVPGHDVVEVVSVQAVITRAGSQDLEAELVVDLLTRVRDVAVAVGV